MRVFIDTSAFYALISSSDLHHGKAVRIWAGLLETRAGMETHNYIVVETAALFQRRFGAKAAAAFLDSIPGVVRVHWIDEALHSQAEAAFHTAGRKTLSLVDCASFEIMRSRSIQTAFAFDEHFEEHGFATLKP